MQIRFASKEIFLDPGKTFSVATVPGARVRVVDGMVWATTSGSLDDVWLRAGQEHTVQSRGLTVIESAARSIVELRPPPTTDTRQSMPLIARFPIPHWLHVVQLDLGAAIVVVVVIGLTVVAGHRFAHGVESLQAMHDAEAHVAATRPGTEQQEIKSGARP
jgi:Protein of unknown function (DUF2917)